MGLKILLPNSNSEIQSPLFYSLQTMVFFVCFVPTSNIEGLSFYNFNDFKRSTTGAFLLNSFC